MLTIWVLSALLNLIILVTTIKGSHRDPYWPGITFLTFWFIAFAPFISSIVVLYGAIKFKEMIDESN